MNKKAFSWNLKEHANDMASDFAKALKPYGKVTNIKVSKFDEKNSPEIEAVIDDEKGHKANVEITQDYTGTTFKMNILGSTIKRGFNLFWWPPAAYDGLSEIFRSVRILFSEVARYGWGKSKVEQVASERFLKIAKKVVVAFESVTEMKRKYEAYLKKYAEDKLGDEVVYNVEADGHYEGKYQRGDYYQPDEYPEFSLDDVDSKLNYDKGLLVIDMGTVLDDAGIEEDSSDSMLALNEACKKEIEFKVSVFFKRKRSSTEYSMGEVNMEAKFKVVGDYVYVELEEGSGKSAEDLVDEKVSEDPEDYGFEDDSGADPD